MSRVQTLRGCEICHKGAPPAEAWLLQHDHREYLVCDTCLEDVPGDLWADYAHSRITLGNSHKMAMMFTSRQGPRLKTDTMFLKGMRAGNGRQFEHNPRVGDIYKRQAARAGVDTTGKVYLSGLAAYPGDPEAWVDSRGDALRVAEQRGWGASEGDSVKVKPRTDFTPPRKDLADDIVADKVLDTLESHPEPQSVDVGELRHEIVEKHKRKAA